MIDKKEINKKELGLYIHIPFCVNKCAYCDFLSAPATDKTKELYVDALINEINGYKDVLKDYKIKTIFIGGGTPSSIKEEYIVRILKAIGQVENIKEVTIEVNPGTLTKAKLEAYLDAGINRLSIGLQSADNEELKVLGRIHTYEEFEENYRLARSVGFKNINIDLMSALPGQTMTKWRETLDKVIILEPEHISAYSLIIEEDTPFYDKYNEGNLPSEEEDRKIYEITKEVLLKNGFTRYEISNYAKPGFESMHNSSYWTGVEYLGLGLGSSSYLNLHRFHNETDLDKYIEVSKDPRQIIKEVTELTIKERMEEYIFLGLRMSKGISKKEFRKKFLVTIESIYERLILKLISQGLIIEDHDRIFLTDKGIDISNYVLSQFILD